MLHCSEKDFFMKRRMKANDGRKSYNSVISLSKLEEFSPVMDGSHAVKIIGDSSHQLGQVSTITNNLFR